MQDSPIHLKWHQRPTVVIIALLMIGPFALPMVWASPAFTKPAKIVITILVIGVTVWLVKMSLNVYQLFMKDIKELQDLKLY